MRVIQLAGGVFAPFHKGHVVAHLLDLLAVDIPLVLGSDDVRDLALVGGEVVLDFTGPILVGTLHENRAAPHITVGVGHPGGVKFVVLEVDFDIIGVKFHILILRHGLVEPRIQDSAGGQHHLCPHGEGKVDLVDHAVGVAQVDDHRSHQMV